MEWIKRMSLRKSLTVIILLFIAIGVILYSLVMNIIRNLQLPVFDNYLDNLIQFIKMIPPYAIAVSVPIIATAIFYKIKLKTPLLQLSLGAKRIMENDLDFSIECNSKDELGQLCESFESMRIELLKSNRELWRQMDERKHLNAAFAHDLRNPVTVLKGSAKILQKGLTQGNLTIENAEESISLIIQYTERIENYIQAMTSVQKLEELPVSPLKTDWSTLIKELENSLSILSANMGKEIQVFSSNGNQQLCVDKYMIYNVAENLVNNALRYSENNIMVDMSYDSEKVVLCVSDDGSGFSTTIINKGATPFLRDENSKYKQNFGMGLYICRLLCEKHGGRLTLENHLAGAKATATFYF